MRLMNFATRLRIAYLAKVNTQRNFSQWQIVGALCLERKPVLTQALNSLQQKYLQFMQQLEIEKSYLSEHEKRIILDKIIEEKMKKGDADVEFASKITAQDFEDSCLEALNKFKPAKRKTEADAENDLRSLQRNLDSTLLLVFKQKLGNDWQWILPQKVNNNGESLRQTVENLSKEICVSKAGIQLCGNAPVGFYKYKYPKSVRGNGVIGAKVFFFKAQVVGKHLDQVTVKKSDDVTDYLWLTHTEIKSVLQPVYCSAVESFLFPDSFNIDCVEDSPESSFDEDENMTVTVSSQV